MGLVWSYLPKYNNEKKSTKLNNNEAVMLQLKTCRDKLKGNIKNLEYQESDLMQKVKLNLKNGNKEKAKMILYRQKMIKSQIDSANGMLMMIYEQISMNDIGSIQASVLKSLSDGNKLIKELSESNENLEKIKQDLDENRENYKELQDFISQNSSSNSNFDDEINKEIQVLLGEYDKNDIKGIKIENFDDKKASIKEDLVDDENADNNNYVEKEVQYNRIASKL